MSEAGNVTENLQAEAKRTAEEAGHRIKAEGERLVGEAQRKAQEVVVERKQAAAEFIHHISEAVGNATDVLDKQGHHATAGLLKSAASELDRFGASVSNRDIDSLLQEFRNLAHRKPSLFFGGALLIGFGVARFFSASASRHRRASESASRSSGAIG